jgi:hypothetical protein
MVKRSKIAFIIPQFGPFPGYIQYFIRSAAYAAGTLDLIFITDQRYPKGYEASNVFFYRMTLPGFNALCKTKLGVPAVVESGYKLCDLKPMYGAIFEDYLVGYAYWAHGDFDMIFGDVNALLQEHTFDRYDIFSVKETYASGPFQIFRNVDKVNRFFMHSSSWRDVFIHPNYVGFDEAGDVIRELWKGKTIWECNGKIQSMTHLMKNEALLAELQIRVSMKELITENFIEGTQLHFDRGKLTVQPGGKELYIYHFMNLKNLPVFNELLLRKKVQAFVFSDKGFFTGNKAEFAVGLVYSFVKRYWIRLIRKISQRLNTPGRTRLN